MDALRGQNLHFEKSEKNKQKFYLDKNIEKMNTFALANH